MYRKQFLKLSILFFKISRTTAPDKLDLSYHLVVRDEFDLRITIMEDDDKNKNLTLRFACAPHTAAFAGELYASIM